MSSKYKAEYETSIKARRIVKDLVQTRMPKGQKFDQACWKAFDKLSPQEQLHAASELRQSNLESAVNPSAYFQHIINKAMYTCKLSRDRSSPTSPARTDYTTLPEKRNMHTNASGTTVLCTTPTVWADPEPAKVKPIVGEEAWTGKSVLASVVNSDLMSGSLDQKCLAYFKELPEAEQLLAANAFKRRVSRETQNPSALLTSIVAHVQRANSSGGSQGIGSAADLPPMPATSKARLNMQRLISDAIFLDDLSPECRRAYEKLPAEAKYRVRQRCAEDASVRTKPEAFMLAIHSITDRISPQPSPAESMISMDEDVLLPAKWADSVDEDLHEDDSPHTQSQAWPPLPPQTQPLTGTPQEGQAPSQGGGQVTSAAATPAAAALPPTRQENPENGEGATESHTAPTFWADPEAAKVDRIKGKRAHKRTEAQTGRGMLAHIAKQGLLSKDLDQECLSYFGELTESQQLQAAAMFQYRVNRDVKNPSSLLTRLIANVQSASRGSGLKRPTPTAKSPYMPGRPGTCLNAQRFSDTLFLYNLSAECRRMYERLSSEAQYRVKQRCAEDEAVRTHSEAFLNAIYDITGKGRPQQQPDEGSDGISEDDLIPAKWSGSADGSQYNEPPPTEMQAWPEDTPGISHWAGSIQPKRIWSSEAQAPSQGKGYSTSAAAPPEAAGVPPKAEAVDAAAQELMGLLISQRSARSASTSQ